MDTSRRGFLGLATAVAVAGATPAAGAQSSPDHEHAGWDLPDLQGADRPVTATLTRCGCRR
jgi:hypothetical protein